MSYLSSEVGITVASLTKWRDKFLMAGINAMKKKPLDEKDREVVRLREKIGRMEVGNPFLLADSSKTGSEKKTRPYWSLDRWGTLRANKVHPFPFSLSWRRLSQGMGKA